MARFFSKLALTGEESKRTDRRGNSLACLIPAERGFSARILQGSMANYLFQMWTWVSRPDGGTTA
jgi:hypothetical protein